MTNDPEAMALLAQAIADNRDDVARFCGAAQAIGVLQHLTDPAAWHALRPHVRGAPREVILSAIDAYLAYASAGEHHTRAQIEPVLHERVPCAERLRAVVKAWDGEALSTDITSAARELLRAEGLKDAFEGERIG